MHRNRSREKHRRDSDPRCNGEAARDEEYFQHRNYSKASRMEFNSNFSCEQPLTEANSITFDFKSSSSKKEAKTPARAPSGKGMIEKQSKRSSPNLIARLMGLDTLPSPRSHKPQEEVNPVGSQKFPSKDFQRKLAGHGCLLRESSDSIQEFKDVFEVMEVPRVENPGNGNVPKHIPDIKPRKMGTTFIPSTERKLQSCKDFDDALEARESDKDPSLKLFRKPHPLFAKHRKHTSLPPSSPHESHSLAQKSSNHCPTASCKSHLRSEIKEKNLGFLQKSDSWRLSKKLETYQNGSFPKMLSDSVFVENFEDHSRLGQIVILKPALEKMGKVEKTVRPNQPSRQCDFIYHRELSKEEVMELYHVERGQMKPETLEIRPNRIAKDAPRKNASAGGRKDSLAKNNSYANANVSSLTSYWTSFNACEHGESFCHSSSPELRKFLDMAVVKKAFPSSFRHLPSSSHVYGNRFVCSTSRSKSHSDGNGNRLAERAVHTSSNDLKHRSHAAPIAKEKHTANVHCPDVLEFFSVPSNNIVMPSLSPKAFGLGERSEKNGRNSKHDNSKEILKQEFADHAMDKLIHSHCTEAASVSPHCFKEAFQLDQFSVLELPSKNQKPNSGNFEETSSNLHGLLNRLQCLKFDSADSFAEEIKALVSIGDEDSGDPFPQLGDMIQAFRNEEDRDYSYLLDILIDSGALKPEKSWPFGELPVGADVFDRLEMKYKSVESWPKCERKLFFDLISFTVASFGSMPPFLNACPWAKPTLFWQSKMAHDGHVEEIWQAVVKNRKEACNHSNEEHILSWSDTENDSDAVGIDLESILSEHLLDQLVKDLVYMYVD